MSRKRYQNLLLNPKMNPKNMRKRRGRGQGGMTMIQPVRSRYLLLLLLFLKLFTNKTM
jgi:hypothetical protein